LLAKLPHYPQELADRQQIAQRYTDTLSDRLQTPVIRSNRSSAWAQYTVKVNNRDALQAKLKDSGIPTAVHYPMPLHLQECFHYLNYKQGDFQISEKLSLEVISLPIGPYLSGNIQNSIIKIIKSYKHQ
jgi:UDP-2-acetamido-2-deoxy-ribo-hexuluronate aminotransferase